MQIYVLRAQRSNGFLLGPAELEGYAELVTLGLVLTNTVGVGSGLADLVLAAQAIDGNAGGTRAGGLRLFGRVAVQRIRSLAVVTAERCAETRLHEFGASLVSRSAQVGLGWRPAEVQLTRPELSQTDKGRIGERIRGGIPLDLKGPPSLLDDRLGYVRQVRHDVDRWGVAVQGWRRDVRIHLETTLRDIRASSALERTRGRAQVDDELTALWSDRARAWPGPYIREFLDIQRKRWVEDRGELAGQVDGVRSTAADDPRDSLAEPLAHLEQELSRRANLWLMALFALICLGIGGWLSWQSIDGLSSIIPFLAAALQAWSNAVRMAAVTLILVVVLLVVVGALLATNTRWNSAYFDIERVMAALIASEASALEREIATVDGHWYLKSISSSVHHVADRMQRLAHLERQLRSVSAPAASASPATIALTRLVPENGQGEADERNLLAELPSADPLLRTTAAGADWIGGDVRRWTHTARELLQRRFAELLVDSAQANETRTAVAVRQILAEWDQPGQGLALSYLSPGLAGQALDPPRGRLVFASGSLEALLTRMPEASGAADVIHVDQWSDELLLFVTQAGLEAAAALA